MRSPRHDSFAHAARARARLRRCARPAFTLVEMIVVIGIIVLLAGLTLTVSSAVLRSSDVQRTRDTLGLLDAAVQAYEAEADRSITWGKRDLPNPGARYDVDVETDEVFIINDVLTTLDRVPAAREILSRIAPDFLVRLDASTPPAWVDTPNERAQYASIYAGTLTVLDPWGTPIYATHPGSPDFDSIFIQPPENYHIEFDPDGTIRTYNEIKYGVTKNRRMAFVSAGPDRTFGDIGAGELEPVNDNVFSYAIDITVPETP